MTALVLNQALLVLLSACCALVIAHALCRLALHNQVWAVHLRRRDVRLVLDPLPLLQHRPPLFFALSAAFSASAFVGLGLDLAWTFLNPQGANPWRPLSPLPWLLLTTCNAVVILGFAVALTPLVATLRQQPPTSDPQTAPPGPTEDDA